MAAKAKLVLYLDTVSPFAYMAYYVTRHSPVFKNVDITYVPIFLGGLMKACGNTAPINIKNKDKWIDVERKRWARLFNIPISDRTPDGFPVLTLTIQRALAALTVSHPEKLVAVQDELYKAFWVDRNEALVNKPEGLSKLLAGVLGENDSRDVMEHSGQAEAKGILAKNTDHAFEVGAFGLPWFECTNAKGEKEGFWGFDHFGQVVQFLGIEKPRDAAWRSML